MAICRSIAKVPSSTRDATVHQRLRSLALKKRRVAFFTSNDSDPTSYNANGHRDQHISERGHSPKSAAFCTSLSFIQFGSPVARLCFQHRQKVPSSQRSNRSLRAPSKEVINSASSPATKNCVPSKDRSDAVVKHGCIMKMQWFITKPMPLSLRKCEYRQSAAANKNAAKPTEPIRCSGL